MELLDVYDKDRNKLDYIHVRSVVPKEGEYHLMAQVCVLDARGRLLLTRRHPKKTWGGLWEVTAGCVLSGEESLPAAMRELAEETGLCVTEREMIPLFTRRISDHHIDCYLVRLNKSGDEVRVTMQEGETTEYIWADDADIARLREEGVIVSISMQAIEYLKNR